ncbi:hypothetical protein N7486_007871 [Penicillium sp. IBT 16267x]|nr:hypothetical protein N7486_007871 [Penicillium sp. IBT 16267x]
MLQHMSVQNITIRMINELFSMAKTQSDLRVLPPGKASPTNEAFMPAQVLQTKGPDEAAEARRGGEKSIFV